VVDNDGSQNGGVVAVKVGTSSTQFLLCTGAVIAPNVVLTARHCVSVSTSQTVACDENGVSGNGAQVGADVDLDLRGRLVGPAPVLSTGTPAAVGKAIFHAQSDILCNADVALVVLDRDLQGVAPLRVRLAKPVVQGESVRAVGYGQNDLGIKDELGLALGTRIRKDSIGVLAVGKQVSTSQTPLASNEFELGLSICEGDSGGPAISEASGAVVGVV
jgi:hypothetical protein